MNTQDLREKYRPRSFADFVGNKRPIEILGDIVKSRRIPNGVLLHGPPGTGKTSLALVQNKALSCENFIEDVCGQCKGCLDFDAVYSNSSGLYTFYDCTRVTEKVLDELSRPGLFGGDIHIFDEFDQAKKSFRDKLRSFLEMQHGRLLIFCAIDINKIDEAFQQRVTVLKTSRPEIEELVPWLKRICESERIIVKGEDVLRQLAVAADRLPRSSLGLLQKISYLGKPLTTSLVREIAQDNRGSADSGSRYRILSSQTN